MRNRALKPRILGKPTNQSIENKQVGEIKTTKDGKGVIEGFEQTGGRNELGYHPATGKEIMEDDLGVDLVELRKGFGSVNEGYEVGFRGGRRSMSSYGGCCFGGKRGWFEESAKNFESL